MEIDLEARRNELVDNPTFSANWTPQGGPRDVAGWTPRSPNGLPVISSSSKPTCKRRRDGGPHGEGVQLGSGEPVSYLLGRTETGPRPLAFSELMMNIA